MVVHSKRGNGGINREVFYCEVGGFDTHSHVVANLAKKLPSFNKAVELFWKEIKTLGLSKQVVVIQGSEFGRTLSPNSNRGSDHGWGGNYFMFGGEVKGGKILGEYPRSFSESDPTNIGRGRLLPTTSWDAMFYGVAQWFGISKEKELQYVLPNSNNFGCNLFTDYDLFDSGIHHLNGCGGVVRSTSVNFQVPDIRHLSGNEQKLVCKLFLKAAESQLSAGNSTVRCHIGEQQVSKADAESDGSGSTHSSSMYNVEAKAVLNFDYTIPPYVASAEECDMLSMTASATASDFVVLDAMAQSQSPSGIPTSSPSTSLPPTMQPTMTTEPSLDPSMYPSMLPTLTARPSTSPTASIPPSEYLSSAPSFTPEPSLVPSTSSLPTVTAAPSARREEFGSDFLSANVGSVTTQGAASEAGTGLYSVQGSGADIWSTSDEFFYMYVESSGDATVTALIESFDGNPLDPWAKVGIMFREDLSHNAAHYSIFTTGSNGIANNYRSSKGGETVHVQTSLFKPDPRVWFRIAKTDDVFATFYKPPESLYWYQFGARLSIPPIDQNGGYFVGVAISSHSTTLLAKAQVGSIRLTRTCPSTTDPFQCDQASNCDLGYVTRACYNVGERPSWELNETMTSVLDTGSFTESLGCTPNDDFDANYLIDGTTKHFDCEGGSGVIIHPTHGRLSMAKALRVYANLDCIECDPVSLTIEGRKKAMYFPQVDPQFPLPEKAEDKCNGTVIDNETTWGDTLCQHTLQPLDGSDPQVADMDGNATILGSPFDEAAYMFERLDDQTWVQVAKLLPGDGSANMFGCSVAISGATAVVGTCAFDEYFGLISQGAAYVFTRDYHTGWTLDSRIEHRKPNATCYEMAFNSSVTDDEFLYEVCIGQNAVSSQILVSATPNVTTNIGTYAGGDGWGTNFVELYWSEGDECGNGLKRGVSFDKVDETPCVCVDLIFLPQAKAEMVCGETPQILNVTQPSACFYTFEMEGPDACPPTGMPSSTPSSDPSSIPSTLPTGYPSHSAVPSISPSSSP